MNNGLVITSDGSQPSSETAVYSQYYLPGDFDVQVDYQLDSTWSAMIAPAGAGSHFQGASFTIYFDGQSSLTLFRDRTASDDLLVLYGIAEGQTVVMGVPFSDLSGTLRISRSGMLIEFMALKGGSWTTVGSWTGPIRQAVFSLGSGNVNAMNSVTTTFRNFKINSGVTNFQAYQLPAQVVARPDFTAGFDSATESAFWELSCSSGTTTACDFHPYAVMASNGFGLAHIRVTTINSSALENTPFEKWGTLLGNSDFWSSQQVGAHLLAEAQQDGMQNYLEMFLSDQNADAGLQNAPAAWQGLSVSDTAAELKNYTYQTVSYYKSKGINIGLYGIGNEIGLGILNFLPGQRLPAPQGASPYEAIEFMQQNVWPIEAQLLDAAIQGVKMADPNARIALHIEGLGLTPADIFVRGFFSTMTNLGVPFDVAALSLPYMSPGWTLPQYTFACWAGRMDAAFRDIAALGKSGMIAEAAYQNSTVNVSVNDPMSEFPLTPQGQASWINANLRFASNNPTVLSFNYFYPEYYPGAAGPNPPADLEAFGLFQNATTVQPGLLEFNRFLATTPAALNISKTHAGNFAQGQNGATYSITVSDTIGAGPTSGTVTVTETVPLGLTLASMAGTGWTCPPGGTTCTRSDVLAAGASYPAITVTVNVASNAASQVTNQVSVSGGGSASAAAADMTAIAATPVRAVSVSPSSGSGASQTFTFVYTDSSGASDFASAQALIGASITGASSCYVWVTPGSGAVWLANDNGSWPAAMTLGTAGTLQNSQCAVNVGSSSGVLSGNTYALNLAITFESGFSGAKNIYSLATNMAGLNSGWQTLGTWTVTGIHAVSVSPASGSGASQTFTFVYTDWNGGSDLASAQALISTSITGVSSCYVWVTPETGAIWLAGDTGNWPSQLTLGTAGMLQNSQCSVNVGSSSGALSGNTYTLDLAISFQSGFSGAKNIYSLATSLAGVNSGWQTVGAWTAGTVGGGPTLQAVSVNPASGSGGSQVFSFQFSDSAGASDLSTVSALINGSTAVSSACSVTYNRANNTLALLTDVGISPSGTITPGSSSQQNSQCTLTGSASSVTVSGNVLTLNLAIGFTSGFAGMKNVYGGAQSAGGTSTGLQPLGTWTVAVISQAPHAVSVSPSSGSGVSQAFTLVYTDSNGASDLGSAQAIINASNSGVSSCYVWVTPGTGAIWLAGDAESWPAAMTLGTAGTLQNGQCAVNVGSSSGALSGSTYTLSLAVTFQSGFSGAKSIYSYATSLAGLNSGWQSLGTWTAGTVGGGPTLHAVSVNPASGSGGSQVFSFQFSDSAGATDLATVSALINGSTALSTACSVTYNRANNTLALLTDAGVSPSGTIAPGSSSQQNSQCTLTGSASSVTVSGNVLTLNLAIGFTSGFAGAKNVYGSAQSSGGTSTGLQPLGTWTVAAISQAPQAVSVSPSSGGGVSQTFAFVYTDSNGASDLGSAQAMINASNSGVSSCYVWVTPGTGAIWLAGDAGNWPAAMTLGTAGTLQNSQCAVNVGSSSGALSGSTYTLSLAVTFQSGFSGVKSTYSYATSLAGLNSGWQTLGTWTAGTVSGGPTLHPVAVNPASGSGGSQVFSFQYSDSAGASDLSTVSALINSSTAVSGACSVTYNRANNTLALLTDAGAQPSGTIAPGSSSQQNSQCTLTGSASSVTVSGNVLTLNLAIGFQSGFAGAKNVYGSAQSAGGTGTGLQQLGTWTVAVTSQAPHAVSVSPPSGSAASQTFTFVYTDSNGASDLGSAQAMINASNSGVSSCYVWVTPGTGAIWLAGDAGNWPAGMTLGTAGTLQNSQCSVNVGSSSGALSGNTYTLSLAVSFQSGFSGAKSIYSYASTLAGLNSGWQTVGTWTP